ncbi:hypothetical protein JTB14_032927 [Gonioctena quinquepunctata]|nr:hypothetical protein JTB14_032927 [Gonioctena quinquepunctata]
MAPDIIRWPAAPRMEIIKRGSNSLANIPNVLGAIDGTHVEIKAPQEFPENYIDRKCFYGITLQAICDHELIFTNCFAGYESSTSDIRIFRNSDI